MKRDSSEEELMMSIRKLNILIVGSCFAALGLAQQVTMQLIPPTGSGAVLGGVYISPYTAIIGAPGQTTAPITGTPTLVICDDFQTDVALSTPPWQAYATNVGSLQGESVPNNTLKFDNGATSALATQQQFEYTVAAYLATEIMQAPTTTARGDLSFALWGLFDTNGYFGMYNSNSGPLSGGWVTGTDLTNAQAALTNAKNVVASNGYTASSFSNVTVYSPAPKTASQEYLVVRTPEPSGFAILAVELSGLAALVYAFRRRAPQTAR